MGYKTKQGDEIAAFMRTMSGRHLNITDITEHFRQVGKPIGTATIYRHLDKLVSDGEIARYITDPSGSACYEYIDRTACHHPSCFHFKCVVCDRLIHMECHELDHVLGHLETEHGFTIYPSRTVFCGICPDCKKKNEDEKQGE